MSDRVNLVAPASPIQCQLYLTHVQAIRYKLGPERLTRLENSNVLRLPVTRDETLTNLCISFHIILYS